MQWLTGRLQLKRMRDHLTNTERLLCARASWWGFESSRETDKWVDMFFRHPVSASLRLLNLILELPFLPLKSWRNFGWTIGLLAVGTAFIMALP